jgi:thioredoxin 1
MIILDKKNFETTTQTNSLVLIDFYADWCGPCQMLKPILEELENDSDFKMIKFAKLDTEQNPELAYRYNVQGIPCMILLKNGKELSRIVGFAPKPVLKVKIKSIIESAK